MNRITEIKVVEDYQIFVGFQDGLKTVIDLQPFLGKGFTKELLLPSEFKKVTIVYNNDPIILKIITSDWFCVEINT